jgi:hypothetical protein
MAAIWAAFYETFLYIFRLIKKFVVAILRFQKWLDVDV